MATNKQIATNQANAQRSTGPKTEASKAASFKSAVQQGAWSGITVAEHEEEALFESLLATLVKENDPPTAIAHQLVERLAVMLWLEIRFVKAEAFEPKANRFNVQTKAKLDKMISNNPLGSLRLKHLQGLEKNSANRNPAASGQISNHAPQSDYTNT